MTAKTNTIKKKRHSLTNDPGEIEKKICISPQPALKSMQCGSKTKDKPYGVKTP